MYAGACLNTELVPASDGSNFEHQALLIQQDELDRMYRQSLIKVGIGIECTNQVRCRDISPFGSACGRQAIRYRPRSIILYSKRRSIDAEVVPSAFTSNSSSSPAPTDIVALFFDVPY